MIQLNAQQTFQVLIEFIKGEINKSQDWTVRDVLSDANTDEKWILDVTGGPTANPQLWLDWEIAINKVINQKNQTGVQLLNKKQSLKSMIFLLEERYFAKNNDISLKQVLNDIQEQTIINKIENTELWSMWLACVDKALKSNQTFES